MTWNHRIIRHRHRDKDGSVTWTNYYITEAYYDENRKVWGITEDPVGVQMEEDWLDPGLDGIENESIEDGVRRILGEQLEWMRQALSAPILDYDDVPEHGSTDPVDAIDDEDLIEWNEAKKTLKEKIDEQNDSSE